MCSLDGLGADVSNSALQTLKHKANTFLLTFLFFLARSHVVHVPHKILCNLLQHKVAAKFLLHILTLL